MGDKPDMAKKGLDFDFSDIAGKTTQVENVEAAKDILQDPKVKKKKEPESPKEKNTGYVIAVPFGKNRWINRDLAECSGEEFVRWALTYYPEVTAAPERFESVGNKVRAFQQIMAWHQSMMRRNVRTTQH